MTASIARQRFYALDGLRGLAALVVVFGHTMLTAPEFANISQGDRDLDGWAWWVSFTPLYVSWAGTAAVFVFFVLSGFVLTLPFDRPDGGPTWRAYYPSRLLRLYVPVWVAVALSVTFVVAVPRDSSGGESWWVAAHDQPLTASGVIGNLTLVQTSWLNSPLWSLTYEVAFSLLLPLYLVVGFRLRNIWMATGAAVGLFAVCGAGVILGSGWLVHMPMFGLGVLLAVHRDRLRELGDRVPRLGWWLAAGAAVVLLSSQRLAFVSILGTPAILAGAVLTVTLFLLWGPAVSFASTRPVQWLGQVSFSLYLVHEPLIVSLAYLFPEWTGVELLPIATISSLLLAWLFFRAVEAPAHRLSQRLRQTLRTDAEAQVQTRRNRTASTGTGFPAP